MEVVTLSDPTVGRATFQPGWKVVRIREADRWDRQLRSAHLGYVVSGRMHVVMNDGAEGDSGPGDLFEIAPGHDAWIVGDEPCVLIGFQGASNYARR